MNLQADLTALGMESAIIDDACMEATAKTAAATMLLERRDRGLGGARVRVVRAAAS